MHWCDQKGIFSISKEWLKVLTLHFQHHYCYCYYGCKCYDLWLRLYLRLVLCLLCERRLSNRYSCNILAFMPLNSIRIVYIVFGLCFLVRYMDCKIGQQIYNCLDKNFQLGPCLKILKFDLLLTSLEFYIPYLHLLARISLLFDVADCEFPSAVKS